MRAPVTGKGEVKTCKSGYGVTSRGVKTVGRKPRGHGNRENGDKGEKERAIESPLKKDRDCGARR